VKRRFPRKVHALKLGGGKTHGGETNQRIKLEWRTSSKLTDRKEIGLTVVGGGGGQLFRSG